MLRYLIGLTCAISLLILVSRARADTLDEVNQRGALRWGGDASGGGPYIFQGPDNQLTGFEFELAQYLADQLGVRSEYVNWEWEMLPQILDRGTIDVVLNGYEWSAELQRKCVHVATGVYALSLPLTFSEPGPVLVLIGLVGVVLLVLRLPRFAHTGVGSTLHGVERKSYGELLLAVSVGFIFYFSVGKPVLYVLPITVLSFVARPMIVRMTVMMIATAQQPGARDTARRLYLDTQRRCLHSVDRSRSARCHQSR